MVIASTITRTQDEFLTQLRAGVGRILVVDDDLHIAGALKDILEDSGYAVETACTGAEAKEKLQQLTFALLIVDYALPDANGIEIARFIRDRYPWLQIILMTGHDLLEISNGDLSPVLSAFLRKPIDVNTILTVVQACLHRQCDRFRIPRFTIDPSWTVVPEPVVRRSGDIKASEAPVAQPAPVATVMNPPSIKVVTMAMAFLLLGLIAGWNGRGLVHESDEVIPVSAIAIDVPAAAEPLHLKEAPATIAAPHMTETKPEILPVVPSVTAETPSSAPAATGEAAPATSAAPAEPITPSAPVPATNPSAAPMTQSRALSPKNLELALESSDPAKALRAAKILLKRNPEHAKATEALISLLHAADAPQRLAAVEAISVSHVASPEVLDALASATHDEDPSVAYAATTVLNNAEVAPQKAGLPSQPSDGV